MSTGAKELVIVDYGVGNLQSLKRAFNFCGVEPVISEDPDVVAVADILVLPGVGSFEAGMRGLKLRGLTEVVKRVIKFQELPEKEKIPQVGWNSVLPSASVSWRGTIFNGLEKRCIVYFVHSYIFKPEDTQNVLGETIYGGLTFCSAVRKGNVYGTQFHPEKSGTVGLEILKNFVTLVN
ncbi:MAG: Imidazole glycerol phosphate synthase subunit HisH [Parcubacteria group bacterium GW2011_GWA2_49_9]|nr:MAG: Imidazole glycerol phosphate synthase subunit HisH [Parcubacteria group bacterium GW2011_GWA2_49_9]